MSTTVAFSGNINSEHAYLNTVHFLDITQTFSTTINAANPTLNSALTIPLPAATSTFILSDTNARSQLINDTVVFGNGIFGTLQTSSQSNITILGTIQNFSASGTAIFTAPLHQIALRNSDYTTSYATSITFNDNSPPISGSQVFWQLGVSSGGGIGNDWYLFGEGSEGPGLVLQFDASGNFFLPKLSQGIVVSSSAGKITSSPVSTGLIVQTSAGVFAARQILGSSLLSITNGSGIAGDISLDVIQGNLSISESQVINLVTDLANKLSLSGGTLNGQLILNADPTAALGAATKQYVDVFANNIYLKGSAEAASTADLGYTYNNASSGVGATLTAPSNGVLVLDGYSVKVGDILLIKDEGNAIQNGIYTVTQTGASVPTILTRSVTYDKPSQMHNGDVVIVLNGATNSFTTWIHTGIVSTIGVDAINFITTTLFHTGTGLTTTGNTVSLTVPVPITLGGTNAITSSQARTNLGLAIGTDVEAWNASLDQISAGTWVGSTSITTLGTISTGVWQGTLIDPTYGGTGANNGSSKITLAGNLTTSGAFPLTLTTTASTNITLPTSGTLVNSAVTTLSSLTSIGTITTGVWNGTIISPVYGGTGVNNGTSTITLGGNLTTSGAFDLTLTQTGTTNVTLPTSGTLVNSAVTTLSSLSNVGTISSGTWNATIISPVYGGTGANNGSSTITLGGSLTTSGAFPLTLTTTASTNVTLPTSGTLVNSAVVTLSSLVITESQVTNLTTDLANKLSLSGGTLTGPLILAADPTTALGAVTKQYVDALSAGLAIKQSVYAAPTSDLTGYVYANGSSGVGATLTAGSNGVFTADGTTPPANSRILVWNQSTTFQNGIYNLTQAGDVTHPAILTRSSDFNTVAQIQPGDLVVVDNGTTYATVGLILTSTVTTIGTDAINFSLFNLMQAGTGLTRTGNTISLTTPVAITLGGTNSTTALSGNQVMVSNGGKIVELGAMTNGQLIIGSTGNLPMIASLGVSANLTATTGAGSLSLNTIQDIQTGSSPTFLGLTLTALSTSSLVATDGAKALQSVTITNANGTNTSFSGSTLAFSMSQDLRSSASPTFANITATLLTSSQPNVTSMSSLATVGTITSGAWQGTVISPSYGGTGANNGSSTLTLAGNLVTSGAFSTTLSMTGTTILTLPTSGTLATLTDITNSTYFKQACYAVATTSDLSNYSYSNGSSGVGATLTSASNAALSADGTSPSTNARILVIGQSTAAQNGIYVLTQQGSVSQPSILTRASDYNTPASITLGDLVAVDNGTIYANTLWTQTTTVATIGTDAITFTLFTVTKAGTGLSLTNNVISLSAPVALNLGGTNASLVADQGGIVYSGASSLSILAHTATANQVLLSGNAAAPSWSNATYPTNTTINQLLYSSATNTISGLPTATNAVLITSSGGVPSLSATLPAAVQTNISSLGTITTGTWQASVISPAYGGTGTNNGSNALTLAANLTTAGASPLTLTTTGTTNVTLPTSGTLVNTAVSTLSSLVITESQVTNLATDLANKLSLSGGALTGPLILAADPTTALGAATKQYVDAVSANLAIKQSVYAATTFNLTGYTYANGTSGVGATLTAGSNGAFTADGTTPPANSRILVWNQSTTTQNGIYNLTQAGDASHPAILTRASDFNTVAQIQTGDLVIVDNGTTYATVGFVLTSTVNTIGTDAITFTFFNVTKAGTGLTLTNNVISLTSPVALNLGGTNANLVADQGGIVYSGASSLSILAHTTTANQVLLSGNAAAPSWSTATYPATTTINQLLYSNAANTISGLATANNAVLITSSGGVPSLSSTLPSAVQTNISSLGTITTGVWNGTIIFPIYGGTGVNNGSSTITLGGNLVTSGAFSLTLTQTATTNVTLPTSGTLVNTAVTTLSSLSSVGTITTGVWNGTIISPTYGGTGVNNGSSTITLAGNLATSGAFPLTLTTTATTDVTLPTSGTLVNSAVTTLSSLSSIGTITTGTWNGTIISPIYGGTGVNNGSSTITLAGNLVTSGAFPLTLTTTASTNVTFPISGTLVNTAVTTLSSLSSIGTITTGVWNGTVISPIYGGTGVNNGSSTLTLAGNLAFSGAFSTTFTVTGTTSLTLPTAGTVATLDVLPDRLPCIAATTANLASYTYANGSSGVGATLTAPSNGVFSVDGQNPGVNARVLVKNQSTASQNGIYTVTTSSAGAPAVLTRATDYNQLSQIHVGDIVPVQTGTVNANTYWQQTSLVVTIGTTSITFQAFNYPTTSTANQVLLSGATSGAQPVWSTATYPTSTTLNQILYSSAANVISGITTATNGVLVTDGTTGIPSISSTLPPITVNGNLLIIAGSKLDTSTAGSLSLGSTATSINLTAASTGNVVIGNALNTVYLGSQGSLNSVVNIQVASGAATGQTNICTGAYAGTLSIGNGASTTALLGTLNANISGSSAVNIGTGTYTGTVSIGNSNTTNINVTAGNNIALAGPFNLNTSGGSQINIGTGTYSGTLSIGNSSIAGMNFVGPFTWESSGNATMTLGNGGGASTINASGNFNWSASSPAASISFNIATNSSDITSKPINLGNHSSTAPSVISLDGTVNFLSTSTPANKASSLQILGTLSQSLPTSPGFTANWNNLAGSYNNYYDYSAHHDSLGLTYTVGNDIGIQIGAMSFNNTGTKYPNSGTINVNITGVVQQAVISYTASGGVLQTLSFTQGQYDPQGTLPATYTDPSPPGTAAVFNLTWGATVVSVAINAGGSSWAVGDKFTIATGTTTYANAAGFATQAIGQVATVSSGAVTSAYVINHNNYNSQFYPLTGVACTAVAPSVGTGLTINATFGASMPFVTGGNANAGFATIRKSFRTIGIHCLSQTFCNGEALTQAQFMNQEIARFDPRGTISTMTGYSSFGTGLFSGSLTLASTTQATTINAGALIFSGGSLSIGRSANPLSGNAMELNFGTAYANRMLCLYDTGGSDTQHNFYGFGVQGGTLRYQIDNLSNAAHTWFAATSNSASNTLMNLTSAGVLTTLHNTLDDGHGNATFSSQNGGYPIIAKTTISSVVVGNNTTVGGSVFAVLQVAGANKVSYGWQAGVGIGIYDPANGWWLSQGTGTAGYVKSANNVLDDGSGQMFLTNNLTSTLNATGAYFSLIARVSRTGSTAVVSGDSLSQYQCLGYDGSAYQTASTIISQVDGTVSAGIVPGRLRFLTADSTGTTHDNLVIHANRSVVTAFNTLDNGNGRMSCPYTTDSTSSLQVGSSSDYSGCYGLVVATPNGNTNYPLGICGYVSSVQKVFLQVQPTGLVKTMNNILDDGSGNMSIYSTNSVQPLTMNTALTSNSISLQYSNGTNGALWKYDTTNGIQLWTGNGSGGWNSWLMQGSTTVGRIQTHSGNVLDNGAGSMTLVGSLALAGGQSISLYPGIYNMYANSTSSVQFTSGSNGGTVWLGNVFTNEVVRTNHNILDNGYANSTFNAAMTINANNTALTLANPTTTSNYRVQQILTGASSLCQYNFGTDSGLNKTTDFYIYDGIQNQMVLKLGTLATGSLQSYKSTLDDGSGNALFGGTYLQPLADISSGFHSRLCNLGGSFSGYYDYIATLDSEALTYTAANDIGIQIGGISINNGGVSYPNSGTITVSISGSASNAVITYTASGGVIQTISFTQGQYDPNFTLPAVYTDPSPPGATPASFNLVWGATVVSIVPHAGSAGSGYAVGDTFSIATGATVYANASGYTIQAIGQVNAVSSGAVTSALIINHNNYNSQFYPTTNIATTTVTGGGTGLTIDAAFGASLPFVVAGGPNMGFSAIRKSFRQIAFYSLAQSFAYGQAITQAAFSGQRLCQMTTMGSVTNCVGYSSFGNGYFNGTLNTTKNTLDDGTGHASFNGTLSINAPNIGSVYINSLSGGAAGVYLSNNGTQNLYLTYGYSGASGTTFYDCVANAKWLWDGGSLSVHSKNNTLDDGFGAMSAKTTLSVGTSLTVGSTLATISNASNYSANGIISSGGIQGNSFLATITGSSGGLFLFDPSTHANKFQIYSPSANNLTIMDVAGGVNPLVISSGVTTVLNLIDSGLTANTMTYANASQQLSSVTLGAASNGASLSFSGGVLSATNSQNLTTSGSPTFNGLTLNGQLACTVNSPVPASFISTSTTNLNETAIQLTNSNSPAPAGLILRWDSAGGIQIQDTSFHAWLAQGGTTVGRVQTYSGNVLDDGNGAMTVITPNSTVTGGLTIQYSGATSDFFSLFNLSATSITTNYYGSAITSSIQYSKLTNNTEPTNPWTVISDGTNIGGAAILSSWGGHQFFVYPSGSSKVNISLTNTQFATYEVLRTTSTGVSFFNGGSAGATVLRTNGNVVTTLKNTLDDGTGHATFNGTFSINAPNLASVYINSASGGCAGVYLSNNGTQNLFLTYGYSGASGTTLYDCLANLKWLWDGGSLSVHSKNNVLGMLVSCVDVCNVCLQMMERVVP